MLRANTLVLGAVVVAVSSVQAVSAQLQMSETYTTTQMIDSVNITLHGARPNARGRAIYGGVVPWNRSWVAGADIATTLEVGRDFRINDTAIPAGRYSLWVVARPDGDWSLRVDPKWNYNHWEDPDSSATQYHAKLKVLKIDPVETLAWSVVSVQGYQATIRMAWGDRAAEFTLTLKSSLSAVTPAADRVAIAGEYTITSVDTASWQGRITAVQVRAADSVLTFDFTGNAMFMAPKGDNWVWTLVPVGPDLYAMGMSYRGELISVFRGVTFEFSRTDGKVTGFEIREFPADKLTMSATKKP